MIPLLLASLAVLDAMFAGFRAACGRDGHIFKRSYYRRALSLGAGSGAALVAGLALLTLVVLLVSRNPGDLYGDLLHIGLRLLIVFLTYVALVLAALALYATARLELRTLATVTILGPFTLLRPWVVAGATLWAVAAGHSGLAIALTVFSSAAVLVVGRLLEWHYGRERIT